jgi:hypothetical protein
MAGLALSETSVARAFRRSSGVILRSSFHHLMFAMAAITQKNKDQ